MKIHRNFLSMLILVPVFLLHTGCVHVTTKTKLNNDYANNRYNRIAVICNDEDSEIAKQTEINVGEYFTNNKIDWVTCFSFSDNYYEESESQKKSFKTKLSRFVKTNQIDGIIFISDGGLNFSSYVTGITRYSRSYAGVNTTTVKSIGLKMELFDAKTHESIWYSKGGASSSSILRSQKDLIDFFVNDSLEKLTNTGLCDEK